MFSYVLQKLLAAGAHVKMDASGARISASPDCNQPEDIIIYWDASEIIAERNNRFVDCVLSMGLQEIVRNIQPRKEKHRVNQSLEEGD